MEKIILAAFNVINVTFVENILMPINLSNKHIPFYAEINNNMIKTSPIYLAFIVSVVNLALLVLFEQSE